MMQPYAGTPTLYCENPFKYSSTLLWKFTSMEQYCFFSPKRFDGSAFFSLKVINNANNIKHKI